jgi:phosphosulfolactate phosphohydrolase-like enzyme
MANNADTTEAVVITPQNKKVRKALADFIQAKADAENAKERKATAEAILREALGDKKFALINGTKAFSLVSSSNTSFDSKTLEKDFPIAYETCVRKTPYDYIRTA